MSVNNLSALPASVRLAELTLAAVLIRPRL
jgi:hypothetical protein